MGHLTKDEAARWVADVLEPAQAERVEAHARGCPDCEALLRAEAVMDARLTRALAQLPVAGPRRLGVAPRALAVVLPTALAAGLALFLARGPWTAVGHAAGVDAGQVALVDSAPRYETSAQVPAEALTAEEPFPL